MCCAGQHSQGWRMPIRAEENSGDAGRMFFSRRTRELCCYQLTHPLPAEDLLSVSTIIREENLKGLKQLPFSLEEKIHKRELLRSFRGLFPF